MTDLGTSAARIEQDPRARTRRSRGRAPALPLSRRDSLVIGGLTFVGLLGLWWLVTALELADPMFLPAPGDVVTAMKDKAADGTLWADIKISTTRVMIGYTAAVVMAIPIGLLAGSNERLSAMIEPVMDFIRYMPVVAFVPLTILWVGTEENQKWLVIWLGTFFQLVLMVSDAVKTVPVAYKNLGATLGMSRSQVNLQIVLPSALPRIWDAMRICLGWAWGWLVLAELVAADTGMGYRVIQAQRFLDTPTIFGYVLALGLIGLLFDQIMRAISRRAFRYEEGGRA